LSNGVKFALENQSVKVSEISDEDQEIMEEEEEEEFNES
jgi:hypothetical protein